MLEYIRQAAETIAREGTRVAIDAGRLSALAARLRTEPVPAWDSELHFFDGTAESAAYTLLLDALNFCFWPTEFTVDYKGKTYGRDDGYCALAVALKRAFEEGIPLWDARVLSGLDEKTFMHVFRGGGMISLCFERLENARNVGRVLIDRYGGDPMRLISSAGGDAGALAVELARNFDAYKDSRVYGAIRFDPLKRAQICVSDLIGSFGTGLGLEGADDLTCFADYKLPQLLHCRGVFVYDETLESTIRRKGIVREGSPEEVEIRANTIVAVERIKAELAKLGRTITSREIDWLLWNESVLGPPLPIPHHRTITTSY